MVMNGPKVFRWVLDVELLWPTPPDGTNGLQPSAREATARWASGKESQYALSLLTPGEQAKVLRFYRPSDAKLSLASCLLKHRAIATTCEVPWSESTIGEDSNRKPCYKPSNPEGKTLEFNVSHHGTLVVLVGCSGGDVRLGVDIVRMNWDKDYATVMKEGFQSWARTYESVFSDREVQDIAHYEAPEHDDVQDTIRAKLRHFYAHWCLKEAYVKMTGEALLAPWLKDVEFRNVQVPLPTSLVVDGAPEVNLWGQTCTDVEIWAHGNRVTDVQLEIQAFRDDYMIATASSHIGAQFSSFKELDLEKDVYP
ncbi:hypothetical protein JMJ35_001216 [Cladonia borealis]|uniref:holo-[acyl-carrier-protein] synthase n=1 Tax=Cladonia borealis TaxID=184061 RepID=A0AA39V516_9LECA|nr:hypothetical protein JMJ35_001216 [Cladonia borealis]